MCLLGVVLKPNGITTLQSHSSSYNRSIIVTMAQRLNGLSTTQQALAVGRELIADFTSTSARGISRERSRG